MLEIRICLFLMGVAVGVGLGALSAGAFIDQRDWGMVILGIGIALLSLASFALAVTPFKPKR